MRIGLVVDSTTPYTSGVTNHVGLLKLELERMGHEPALFVFAPNGTRFDEDNVFASKGVKITREGYTIGLRYNRIAKARLREMDILHLHHPFVSGPLARRVVRNTNIPVVYTNHTRYDLYSHYYSPRLIAPVINSITSAYMVQFCRNLAAVISPSKNAAKGLARIGITAPIHVIPNGIPLEAFQKPETCTRPDGRVRFLYCGRLGPEKNVPFLLRSFQKALKRGMNAELILVGGGPLDEELRVMSETLGLQDHLQFVGSLPYDEVPPQYWRADVFVSASFSEVHPLTFLEAMAAGLPVIGVRSAAVQDLLEDNDAGIMAELREDSLAEKMVTLANDPARREKMAALALAESKEYGSELNAFRLVRLYEQVAG